VAADLQSASVAIVTEPAGHTFVFFVPTAVKTPYAHTVFTSTRIQQGAQKKQTMRGKQTGEKKYHLSAAELMATVAKTNRAHAPPLDGITTVKAAA